LLQWIVASNVPLLKSACQAVGDPFPSTFTLKPSLLSWLAMSWSSV